MSSGTSRRRSVPFSAALEILVAGGIVEPDYGQPDRVEPQLSDSNTLDTSLSALWERARAAVDLIGRLREENHVLGERLHELELRLQTTQQQFREIQEQLKAQPVQQGTHESPQPSLRNGELEALKGRVKEILTKLDAYL